MGASHLVFPTFWKFAERLRPYLVGGLFFWIWLAFTDSSIASAFERVVIGLLFSLAVLAKLREKTAVNVSLFTFLFTFYIVYEGLLLLIAPLPQYSIDKVLEHLSILFLFVFFRQQIADNTQTKTWENAFITVVMVISFLELSMFFVWYGFWVKISGSVFSPPPIGYRLAGVFLPGANFTSAFVNLVLPLVLVRFIFQQTRLYKMIWGSILILVGIIQYFSSSRTGWLGALGAVGVTMLLIYGRSWLSLWRERRSNQLPPLSRRNLGIGILALIASVGIVILFTKQVQITPGHFGLLSGRLDIWANSLRIWSTAILTGRGPGSFPLLYSLEVMLPPGWMPDNAHNLWLQVGTETGILGLGLVACMFLAAGLAFIRIWKISSEDAKTAGKLAAYAGIGAAIFIQHLGAFYFHIPLYTILAVLLLALSLAHAPGGGYEVRKPTYLAISTLLVAVYLSGSWFALRGQGSQMRGLVAIWNNDLEKGQKYICESARIGSAFSVYDFQCSMLSAQLSYANSNLNLLKIATEAQTRGLEKDPYWPLNWANLGMLVWGEGNHEKAISYMQTAVDKAPRSSLFALNLGWMAEQNGQTDLALRTYIAALENEPWLQVSPFFTQTGVRTSALRSAALDESLVPVGKLNLQGYRAYKAGQLELAASHLTSAIQADPSNGETLALLALLAQKRGRLEEAWLSAQTAAFVDRDSPRVLTWAAHVALEQGRVPDAVGYIERALENWKLYKELYNSEYFYFVYHRMTLQENLVPGYQRADVTDEMVASYLWLAWYYESNHMTLAAKDMLRLLEISGLH